MRSNVLLAAFASIATPSSFAFQAGSPLELPARNFLADVGVEVHRAATGDFDEDGDADLALAERLLGDWSVAIRLGDGAGGFTQTVHLPATLASPRSLIVVDWNNDGNDDVLFTGTHPTQLSQVDTFLGDGAGGFVAAPIPLPTKDAESASASDWNGDGVVDLVIVDADDSTQVWTVYTLINDGSGGIATTHSMAPGKAANHFVAGDFDSDGDLDAAATVSIGGFTTPDELQLYLNDGNGVFTAGLALSVVNTAYVEVADLDDDGLVDVALNVFATGVARIDVFYGDGAGGLSAPTQIPLSFSPSNVFARDLDGDDLPELIAGGALMAIARNQGAGSFATPVDYPLGAGTDRSVFGDWNGDGRLDVVFPVTSSLVTVGLGRADLGFGVPPIVATDAVAWTQSDVADFDGDGKLDILTFNEDSIRVLLGDAAFGMTPDVLHSHPSNDYVAAIAADLDDDGDQDVVASNCLSGFVDVLTNDGDGDFTVASVPAGVRPEALAAGDLTGDGLFDLVVSHDELTPDDVVIYSADGNGGYVAWLQIPTGTPVTALRVIDLDRDGDLDLAIRAIGGPRAYFNDGFGSFGPAVTIGTSAHVAIELADLDGDDAPDFVGVRTTAIDYALNDGSGAFGALQTLDPDVTISSARAVDLDGDGRRDLVVTGMTFGTDQVVYRNLGAGSFAAPTHWATCGGGSPLIADFDRDGKRDLALVEGGVHFFPNLSATGSNGFIYCDGKQNSQGCTARLGAVGAASASLPDGFDVTASKMLNKKTGQFFYSVAGVGVAPFAGGILCAKPPLKRVQPLANTGGSAVGTDCTGVLSVDVNALIASGSHPALTAGATAWMQAWSRDPGFAPPENLSLTDALSFVVAP